MKKLLAIIFLTFVAMSCDNNDLDEMIKDNYYVKYSIIGNGTYGHISNWTATTPQGIYSNSGYQVRGWNQTYGPVNKGFKCEVHIDDYIGGAPTIEIYVSKNAEPFALKVSERGRSATYTLDN